MTEKNVFINRLIYIFDILESGGTKKCITVENSNTVIIE